MKKSFLTDSFKSKCTKKLHPLTCTFVVSVYLSILSSLLHRPLAWSTVLDEVSCTWHHELFAAIGHGRLSRRLGTPFRLTEETRECVKIYT